MDTKRLILPMLLCLAIIFGWQVLVWQWYKQHPEAVRHPTTQIAETSFPTTSPTVATSQQVTGPTTSPSTRSVPSMTAGAPAFAPRPPTTAPAIVKLGAENQYNTQLRINTRGGAIDSAILKEFKDATGTGQYTFQTPTDPQKPDTSALALRALTINGTTIDISTAVWNVDEQSPNHLRLWLEILSGEKPILRITRTFDITPKTDAGKGFDHKLSETYANLSAQLLTVKSFFNGPTMPPREMERGFDLQIQGGYNNDRDVTVTNHAIESFDTKNPTLDLTLGDKKYPFLWVGTASVYFDAILQPISLDPNNPSPRWISKITGEALNPDSDPHVRQVRVTLETDELKLTPNQSLTLNQSLFLGPKQRKLLNNAYYAAFPRSYDHALVISSGPCSFCTFQWLINILVNILGVFHFILRDWGLAIIGLVLLVRAILHPITKRSQISMMKMGKMGPEMERLKKKYADDKDALNKEMWNLQKEQGLTPVLGCLPMFLQMPIWIALWQALQTTFELRQAPFLYNLTWIHDLAKPDQLIQFGKPIPLLVFGWQLHAINLLPILMLGVTWLNQKFMPKPAATTPEQEQQQKMMMWMTLFFPLMFYTFPSGLNLYYVTSMGLGIIESKIIRDHIKQREEEEKAGKVIIDAPRGMKKKRGDEGFGATGAKRKPKPAPTGFFGKWMAEMQSKMEEIRKQADRGGK